MKTSNLILLILGVLIVTFIVTMIITFWRFQSVPDALITSFFICVGGECGVMGWIKTTKERNKEREWQLEDEKRHKEEEDGTNAD